jgi:hypothetical protein
LFDCLIRADPSKSRWTIGSDRQQWDTRFVGFDDRLEQVRGGRSRCRDNRGWHPGRLTYTQREESSDPLVNANVHSNFTALFRSRSCQR